MGAASVAAWPGNPSPDTASGPLQVFGVCIPWRDAHVRSGRKDREGWEDHVAYLRGLRRILAERDREIPAVVVGDYNQRVPRHMTPIRVHGELLETFAEAWTICTAGELEGEESLAIDQFLAGRPASPQSGKAYGPHVLPPATSVTRSALEIAKWDSRFGSSISNSRKRSPLGTSMSATRYP